jgi:hypothetical protein
VPLQITPAGLTVPSADETAGLARVFGAAHVVRLPALLHPAILQRLQARLAAEGTWKTFCHPLPGGEQATELVCTETIAVGLLTAMFHDAALFTFVRAVTACDPIGSFHGRIYRMDPRAHADAWHDDANDKYLVALSLNLTDRPFAGGELHLRDRASRRVYAEAGNTGPGDAIVFRLDPALEHMVAPVTGDVPKIAWAGWFHRDRFAPELDRLAGLRPAW